MLLNVLFFGGLWLIALLLWRNVSKQFAVAYLYCLLCLICMVISTCIAWYRTPNYFLLPDIGHNLLPELSTVFGLDAHKLCDYLLYVTSASTLAFALLNPKRYIILKRVCMVYGTLMLMRSVTLLVTSLPDPYLLCDLRTPGTYDWSDMPWLNVATDVIGMFGPNDRESLTCGDLIFSGHTVLFVLCALVWHTYYKSFGVINPCKLLIWVLSVVGTVLLLVTRMHWTIDILLAYYVTVTLWNFYHAVCNNLQHGHCMNHVVWVDGAFVYPFIAWVETGCSYAEYHRMNKQHVI